MTRRVLTLDRNRARDLLIKRVESGRYSPEAAEVRAAQYGVGPLARKPDPADFDPRTQARWTLPMVVAWIATRSLDEVRVHWEEYRSSGYWFWCPAPAGETTSAWRLRCLEPMSVAGMVIYEATNAASSEGGRSAYLIRDAVRSLWAALQAKRIEAIGKDMGPSARYRDIPSPEWHGLEAAEIKGWGWSSSIRSRDHTHGYDDVTLERAKVILLWPADVALSSTDQVEHASPKPTAADLYAVWVSAHEGKPPASEKEDWAYLKQTFPKMTRARAREIRRQHAPPEWRRKGRRGAKEIREI